MGIKFHFIYQLFKFCRGARKASYFALMSFFFLSELAFSLSVQQIEDFKTFVELNDGKSIYSNTQGVMYEIVTEPGGKIINHELYSRVFEGKQIKKMLPYAKGGFVALVDEHVYAILDSNSPRQNLLIAEGVDIKDIAVVGDHVFLLSTANSYTGDIWGKNILSGKSTSSVAEPILLKAEQMIGVGTHLVFFFENGDIEKMHVQPNGSFDFEQRIRIGSDWKGASIFPLNDDYFVLKSQADYIRLRKVTDVTYETVENHDVYIDYFSQGLKLHDYNSHIFFNNNYFISSSKMHQRRIDSLDRNVERRAFYSANLEPNKSHFGTYPRCPVIADYPSSKVIILDPPIVAIKLDPSLYLNIPLSIRTQLTERNISPDSVDLFINIQRSTFLGEEDDHKDGSPLTSRIKLHPWADPTTPADFEGTRIDRDFLIGIFEPEFLTIKVGIPEYDRWEVNINELKPFNVEVHDNKYSPQTARIRISKEDQEKTSQCFWSLGIDHKSKTKLRAAATLHCLVNWKESEALSEQIENKTNLGKLMRSMINWANTLNSRQMDKMLMSIFKGLPF